MYLNNSKAERQSDAGLIDKIVAYWPFVALLGLVEWLLTYYGLQLLDDSISNLGLIPLTSALSVSMVFSAHYAGEALREKKLKSITVAGALGITFLFIIGYLRAVTDAPFILTLTNIGFFGVCAYVSYLRSGGQHYFRLSDDIDKLVFEDAYINASLQNRLDKMEEAKVDLSEESTRYATDLHAHETKRIEHLAETSDYILECIEDYEHNSMSRIKLIEDSALNDLSKF